MIYFSFYNFTGSCGTYIHVCTYLLAETCSTEMRHAYGREQKSFAVWFELICHHNLCIAVEFMRKEINTFLTFPACFLIPIIFSSLNYNCSNLLDLWNLLEQVKKTFCYQKLVWPFTERWRHTKYKPPWDEGFSFRRNLVSVRIIH